MEYFEEKNSASKEQQVAAESKPEEQETNKTEEVTPIAADSSPAAEAKVSTDEEATTTSKSASKPKKVKLNSVGYIGHLTLISNLLYTNSEEGNYSKFIQKYITDRKWPVSFYITSHFISLNI